MERYHINAWALSMMALHKAELAKAKPEDKGALAATCAFYLAISDKMGVSRDD